MDMSKEHTSTVELRSAGRESTSRFGFNFNVPSTADSPSFRNSNHLNELPSSLSIHQSSGNSHRSRSSSPIKAKVSYEVQVCILRKGRIVTSVIEPILLYDSLPVPPPKYAPRYGPVVAPGCDFTSKTLGNRWSSTPDFLEIHVDPRTAFTFLRHNNMATLQMHMKFTLGLHDGLDALRSKHGDAGIYIKWRLARHTYVAQPETAQTTTFDPEYHMAHVRNPTWRAGNEKGRWVAESIVEFYLPKRLAPAPTFKAHWVERRYSLDMDLSIPRWWDAVANLQKGVRVVYDDSGKGQDGGGQTEDVLPAYRP